MKQDLCWEEQLRLSTFIHFFVCILIRLREYYMHKTTSVYHGPNVFFVSIWISA